MANENDKAAEQLAHEKAKFGFGDNKAKPNEAKDSDLEDESEDKGDLDFEEEEDESEEETKDEEASDKDEEDSDEDDSEDEEDEEDDSDEDRSQKKNKRGVVPFKAHNELRKELRDTQDKLDKALKNNKDLEDKLPDDFQERAEALAKKIGVEDPKGLVEIIKFLKEAAVDKNTKGLEERLANMEKEVLASKAPVDEFPKEWNTFNSSVFEKEFPNASKEQIKSAEELMSKLAHSPKTGGKTYKDQASGQDVLDPFPLEYLFWKNRDEFKSIVTGKKVRSMETGKTQRFNAKEDDGDIKHLNKHSSAADTRSLDKKYAAMEAEGSSLRSPESSTI